MSAHWLPGTPWPVAAVTHGGITADLLCNLLGDDALPAPAGCGHSTVRRHHH
jgi:hypothetical protein